MVTPVTIVLHELGHFFAAKAFGASDVALHYDAISNGTLGTSFPLWQQGLEAAAGPFVTLVLVLGCVSAVVCLGPRVMLIAMAFAAGSRSVILGWGYLIVRIVNPRGAGSGFGDELIMARGFGLPLDAVVSVSTLIVMVAWWYLLGQIKKNQRVPASIGILLGTIAGVSLWMLLLGPLLLP